MGSVCHGYMCILLYVKLVQWFFRDLCSIGGVKLRVNLSCTLHVKIILLLATRCQSPGGKHEGAYGSKPEGDSGSKLCQ